MATESRIETKCIPYGDTQIMVSYKISGSNRPTFIQHMGNWYPGDGVEVFVDSATKMNGEEIDLELLDIEHLIESYELQ